MLFSVSFVQHKCNIRIVSVTLTSQHGVDLIQVDKDAESVLEACELASAILRSSDRREPLQYSMASGSVAYRGSRRVGVEVLVAPSLCVFTEDPWPTGEDVSPSDRTSRVAAGSSGLSIGLIRLSNIGPPASGHGGHRHGVDRRMTCPTGRRLVEELPTPGG